MDVQIRRAEPAQRAAGMLAVGVCEGREDWTDGARAVDRVTRGALRDLMASGDMKGKPGEATLLHPRGLKAKRVLVVGLGPRAALRATGLAAAAGTAARRARELGAGTLSLALWSSAETAPGIEAAAAAQALAEGAVVGHYRHQAYRSDAKPAPLTRVEILEPGAPAARRLAAAVARGARIAEGTCLARDLANTPGDDLVPERLAARAREVARDVGATCTVLDPAAMQRLGMGGVLAVGRGSPNTPRFVALDWSPRGAAKRGAKRPTLVIIGKGVTFDTGGLSLKPREGMSKMKYDMAGSAAVLGLFHALPVLAPAARIVGLVPSAENMPGDRSVKPGDVIRHMDGTTVEITNTDAEGRLLLADALVYARRYAPDAIVDLATLTGAITIALGRHAAGLFSDDDALAGALQAAGEATGERLWRMPVWDEYLAEMKSDTADLVNSNERREGASCTAAAYLKHFVKGRPWAHLDIASTAWNFADVALGPRGANGFGVRLLAEWIVRRDAAPGRS